MLKTGLNIKIDLNELVRNLISEAGKQRGRLLLLFVMKIFLLLFSLLFAGTAGTAQTAIVWPSPEIERVYEQGREALSTGNFQQARQLLQQAADLAPEVPQAREELAYARLLGGDAEGALTSLEPLFDARTAGPQAYRTAADANRKLKKTDAAAKILRTGLRAYPNSGMLFNEQGQFEEAAGKPEEALKSWLNGIEFDPAYYLNYYYAAQQYVFSKKLVWCLLYAETFLLYEYKTPRATEARQMLFAAYRRFFFPNAADEKLNPGSTRLNTRTPRSFEEAVVVTLRRQAPVVAGGVTTESLTMLRTRFLIEWNEEWAKRYPSALFRYQDEMLRTGVFEAYNQQLLGRAEAGSGFEKWVEFHTRAIPDFAAWIAANPFKKPKDEFYNGGETKGILYKTLP